ncbi:hypothetical protein HZA40_04725 [Candidatus Peregrinibacteria bacterium]|nr:hypothetical protein [Candidatus Peregrinibacteria bacterium]
MFVSLDLETTGFDPNIDKIIEFGAVKFDLTGQKETLKFFVNPGITLPKIITHITNIKDSDLKNAPAFADKKNEIQNFIGNLPVIGHNIKFDLAFLESNGVEIKNSSYDTQELSGILLPNMPSYSLEILSEKLQLKHSEKHRALDDSIAAMELFLNLIKEFEQLDPELLGEMKTLSQRSNWPIKDLLKTLNSNGPKPKNKIVEKEKNLPNEEADTACGKILAQKESALFELSPPYNELVKALCAKATPDTHICIPYQLFRKIDKEIPDSVAKIDVAKNYLSAARLKKFSEKTFFENHEISSLLKYLNWSKQTKTGLLSEVALFHEERNTINKVNIDENITDPKEEFFFKKALEQDSKNPALCTNQYLIENPPENKKLIIINFGNFLNSLHFHKSIYLKLEPIIDILKSIDELALGNAIIKTLIGKITILFGLLGIIFEKFNDQNIFGAKSTVNDEILQTKEWLDAQKSISNIIEISQELGQIKNNETSGYLTQWKNFLKNIHSVLFTPKIIENLVWLEKDPQGNMVLRKSPFSLKEDLNKILEKAPSYQIIDECLDLNDDCKFIKTFANLKKDLPLQKLDHKAANLEIYITKDTDGSDPNKIPRFIKKYYAEKSKNIALIFSAKKDLEFLTLKLDSNDLPTLPQLAGSLGKIQELYLNDKKASISPILLLTNRLWENFEYSESIDTLFIFKVPFEPPSDPKLLTLSRNYENPFMELQVPLALTATKKIINRLKNSGSSLKKVIILDMRLTNKRYGEIFIDNFNSIAPINIVKLHTLLF